MAAEHLKCGWSKMTCMVAKKCSIVYVAGNTLLLEGAGLEGGRCWRGQRRLESRVGVRHRPKRGEESEFQPGLNVSEVSDSTRKQWDLIGPFTQI